VPFVFSSDTAYNDDPEETAEEAAEASAMLFIAFKQYNPERFFEVICYLDTLLKNKTFLKS